MRLAWRKLARCFMVQAAVFMEQGPRWRMEDAHVLRYGLLQNHDVFAGIYDGHLGDYAASYAAQTLHVKFASHMQKGQDPAQAFLLSYHAVSQELASFDSGTTALNFYLLGRELALANAGDSRAIIITRKNVKQLTKDHRLDQDQERLRIEVYGAEVRYPYVLRAGQGLMPTRSLGDSFFQPVGVIPSPELHTELIQDSDLWLVAGTDGLFDFMSNQEVAIAVRGSSSAQAAVEALGEEVLLKRKGSDNLTVIALALQA